MRVVISLLAPGVLASAAEACPPPPSPPSPNAGGDAGPVFDADAGASIYVRACANIAAKGCSEGIKPNCAAVLEHAQLARISDYDPPCLSGATSKAAVRACGMHGVRCP
jgi:hypothetical protein